MPRDYSGTAHTLFLQSRAQQGHANALAQRPDVLRREMNGAGYDASTYTARTLGTVTNTMKSELVGVYQEKGCCTERECPVPGSVDITFDSISYNDPFYIINVSWSASPGGMSYTVTTNQPDATITKIGFRSVSIATQFLVGTEVIVTVKAINECGSTETASSIIPSI